ncbi:MAG: SDR family oxidoreductase [Halolamina sp.]|uniref:SDR family oxidoreductase n=1 Tax=Halolamina sp. TaxID=1940283 RepID=UPI002FC3C0CA
MLFQSGCSRACARRPGGRILDVGYAGSENPLAGPVNFPYFVARTGVLMFTRMLASETQDDGVTVNAVSPSVIETGDAFPEEAPLGRWATVEDVAKPALLLSG